VLTLRLWPLVLLPLGCARPAMQAKPSDAEGSAHADSGRGDTGRGDTGRGDTGAPGDSGEPPAEYGCPVGMAPVPSDSPSYCIDAYELSEAGASVASVAGALPITGITYDDAVAACEARVVLDDAGGAYATPHLATASEWEDAGDGVLGAGGAAFPWGETFDESLCVTLSDEGELQFDGLQPTGSMPECRTEGGVYDQIGNAWEWTDSGQRLDIDGALAALAAEGVTLEIVPSGATDELLRLEALESLSTLSIEAAGLHPSTVYAEADGTLYVTSAQVEPSHESFFARGYLERDHSTDTLIPVALLPVDLADPDTLWRVALAREYDGSTVPDKRGCAWYTGTGGGCGLDEGSLVHLPDFDGTIGFRCVVEPYAR
jgi:hypothetical protein